METVDVKTAMSGGDDLHDQHDGDAYDEGEDYLYDTWNVDSVDLEFKTG